MSVIRHPIKEMPDHGNIVVAIELCPVTVVGLYAKDGKWYGATSHQHIPHSKFLPGSYWFDIPKE